MGLEVAIMLSVWGFVAVVLHAIGTAGVPR